MWILISILVVIYFCYTEYKQDKEEEKNMKRHGSLGRGGMKL